MVINVVLNSGSDNFQQWSFNLAKQHCGNVCYKLHTLITLQHTHVEDHAVSSFKNQRIHWVIANFVSKYYSLFQKYEQLKLMRPNQARSITQIRFQRSTKQKSRWNIFTAIQRTLGGRININPEITMNSYEPTKNSKLKQPISIIRFLFFWLKRTKH